MKSVLWFLSIRGKLIIMLLLITLFPLVIISYSFYSKTLSTINLSTDTFMRDIMEQNIREFHNKLNVWEEVVKEFTNARPVQRFLNANNPDILEELNIINELVPYLQRFDNKYDISKASIIPLSNVNYPIYNKMITYSKDTIPDDLFVRIIDENVFWSNYLDVSNTGEMIWTRYNLMWDFNTFKPKAILALSTTSQSIIKSAQLPSRWKNQQTLIINNEGIVIADSLQKGLLGKSIAANLLSNIHTNHFGSQDTTIDDIQMKTTYGPLPIEGLYLINMIPVAELLEPIIVIRKYYLIFVGIIVIFTIIIAYIMGKRFTRPIFQLVSLMKNFQLGQLDKMIIKYNNRDEVGFLIQGYYSMLNRITFLIENVRESEQRKKELHLTVLSNQINPHLVYNTLDLIKWNLRKNRHTDHEETQELINCLVDFMRLTLNQGKELTSLAKELDHINAYVKLESLRQPNSFEFIYNIPIPILEAPMLKLILQPIVENTILHAKVHGKKCNILISCRQIDHELIIQIVDNGPGFPLEMIQLSIGELIDQHKIGIGLSNVHERIRMKYGDDYGIHIANGSNKGAIVTIKFPFETVEPEGV